MIKLCTYISMGRWDQGHEISRYLYLFIYLLVIYRFTEHFSIENSLFMLENIIYGIN